MTQSEQHATVSHIMPCQHYQAALSRPLTILIGGQGSGKSEFAIMWARRLAANDHGPVILVDLDLFKPMFRSREAEAHLAREGIRVVASSLPVGHMPSFASLAGELERKRMVIDVGGDAHGVRVLRSMRPSLSARDYNLLFVLNTRRPRTSDYDSAAAELDSIGSESGISVTGLVSNTHLLDETDDAMVQQGLETTRRLASHRGLELVAVMIPESLRQRVKVEDVEMFTLRRMLTPPWIR